MSLKITNLSVQPHLPGTNELRNISVCDIPVWSRIFHVSNHSAIFCYGMPIQTLQPFLKKIRNMFWKWNVNQCLFQAEQAKILGFFHNVDLNHACVSKARHIYIPVAADALSPNDKISWKPAWQCWKYSWRYAVVWAIYCTSPADTACLIGSQINHDMTKMGIGVSGMSRIAQLLSNPVAHVDGLVVNYGISNTYVLQIP